MAKPKQNINRRTVKDMTIDKIIELYDPIETESKKDMKQVSMFLNTLNYKSLKEVALDLKIFKGQSKYKEL